MDDSAKSCRREEFFSGVAGVYDLNLRVNGYFWAVDYVMRHLPLAPYERFAVMDAGCGTGLYSIGALKNFPNCRVYAFDSNVAMANRARKNILKHGFAERCEIHVTDIENRFVLAEPSFELVITAGLLEYVAAEAAIEQLGRCLAPGGMFLNAPVKNNMLGRAIGKRCFYVPYSREDNVQMFRRCGLDLIQTVVLPWYLPISFVKEVHVFQRRVG